MDLQIIRDFEGFRGSAYPDPETGGVPYTIGYGTTRYADGRAVRPGDTITEAQAQAQLLAYVEQQIVPHLQRIPGWGEMSEGQRSALVDFAYNLGAGFYGAPGFETLSALLRARDWAGVPETFRLYSDPGSACHAGLLRRREAEAQLWLGARPTTTGRPISVTVDGQPVSCNARTEGGVTRCDLRPLVDALGWHLLIEDWQTLALVNASSQIAPHGMKSMTSSAPRVRTDEGRTIDCHALVEGGRTRAGLRPVAAALGYAVECTGSTLTLRRQHA